MNMHSILFGARIQIDKKLILMMLSALYEHDLAKKSKRTESSRFKKYVHRHRRCGALEKWRWTNMGEIRSDVG
jgi:transcription initiation factor IIE alpha subunit